MSQSGNFIISGSSSSNIQTVTGNSGGAVGPDGTFNINLVGSGDMSVVGNSATNTLTISALGTLANTFTTDSGNASPALNILNVLGGTLINTSGSGSTVTINSEPDPSIITAFEIKSSMFLKKTIVVNANFDLNSSNNLTISIANNVEVIAEVANKASISVIGTITGITGANYPNLTLTTAAGSNIIDANIIVNGDFTVSEDLTINGDLTVIGGNVTIATTKTLIVKGSIIFDGLSQNKQVDIAGNIGNASNKVLDCLICNYIVAAGTGQNHAVEVAGTIASSKDIKFKNNKGGDSSNSAGGVGVLIGGTITADTDITIRNGVGGASTGGSFAGGAGCRINGTVNCGGILLALANTGAIGAASVATGVDILGTINSARDIVFLRNRGVDSASTVAPSSAIIFATDSSVVGSADCNFIENQGGASTGVSDVVGSSAVTFNDMDISAANLLMSKNVAGNSVSGTGGEALILNGAQINVSNLLVFNNTGGNGGTNGGKGLIQLPLAANNIKASNTVNFYGNTGGNGAANNLGNFGGNAVQLAATITATNIISFYENRGGTSAGEFAGNGISIDGGLYTAENFIATDNVGANSGGATFNAGAGFKKASAIGAVINASGSIIFTRNVGGAGSGSGVGSAGGQGVWLEGNLDIRATRNIEFYFNQGGQANGSGDNNGGAGVLLQDLALEAKRDLILEHNRGGVKSNSGTDGLGLRTTAGGHNRCTNVYYDVNCTTLLESINFSATALAEYYTGTGVTAFTKNVGTCTIS